MDKNKINFKCCLIAVGIYTLMSSLASVSAFHSCCDMFTYVKNTEKCENGLDILPQCEGIRIKLNSSNNADPFYVLTEDNKGQYLNVYPNPRYIVFWPGYCVGETFRQDTPWNFTDSVAIVCSTDRIWIHDEVDSKIMSPWKLFVQFLSFLDSFFGSLRRLTLLNLVSGLLMAITSIIFAIKPHEDSIKGKCMVHLALTTSLSHLAVVYRIIFRDVRLTSKLCTVDVFLVSYIFQTSFMWSSVLAYHLWNKFSENANFNPSRLMTHYRIVGYGIPALLVLFSSTHWCLWNLYNADDAFPFVCSHKDILMIIIYTVLPLIVVLMANCFFFFDLHRKMWNMSNLQEKAMSNLKKIKSRLLWSVKQFIIMGLSWLIVLICGIPLFWVENDDYEYFLDYSMYFISGQGIYMFFIWIVFNKRCWSSLVNKFGFLRWKLRRDVDSTQKKNLVDIDNDVES